MVAPFLQAPSKEMIIVDDVRNWPHQRLRLGSFSIPSLRDFLRCCDEIEWSIEVAVDGDDVAGSGARRGVSIIGARPVSELRTRFVWGEEKREEGELSTGGTDTTTRHHSRR